MTGLDTNVLVRYIMQDDVLQARLASELIETFTVDEPGFIPLAAVIELVWVLLSSFELARSQVVQALEVLLRTKEIQVENAATVWRAVRLFRAGPADFADCLIERSATVAGCTRTMTFDRDTVKHCAMTLIG